MHGKSARCLSSIGDRQKPTQECKSPRLLISPGNAFAATAITGPIIAAGKVVEQLLAWTECFDSDGGFLFAADPEQAFDAQTIFWAPEALPTVLRVGRGSAMAISRSYDVDIGELSGADLRLASDGWHAVFRLGGATHRLWLRQLPARGAPIVLELPLDANFDLQSHAAYRLWSALGRRALAGSYPALSVQRRKRLVLAIRALDGRIEGNSYRVIAEGLFGTNRVPERSWKTNDLRNRTIRLVQTGLSLMRSGYRTLLRHKRKR